MDIEEKARWLRARQSILNVLAPLEGGALLYRGRELSQGFTQKKIFRLRKKLAKIDEGVPSEWLTNTSPALLERLSGSTWDVSAIIELIEQYEGGGNSDG